jgi:glucokinase
MSTPPTTQQRSVPGGDKSARPSARAVLLADVGGTNARFALLQDDGIGAVEYAAVADHPSFTEALTPFLRKYPGLSSAVFGVAGPVENGHCLIVNSGWVVDAAELRTKFGLQQVRVLNDFEAVAHSLLHLVAADLHPIGGGTTVRGAPMLVLGAGTGLGVAALVPHPSGPIVIATEGGHASLPASSRREDAVLDRLRERFDHVSIERALSGPGLENLYAAIAAVDKVAAPPRGAPEIMQHALKGDCELSRAALEMFCAMLGTVAGGLALTFRARGGVFIGGGMAPRFVDFIERSQFRTRFESMGRFSAYLAAIPTSVIVQPDVAFIGLRVVAEREHLIGS